MTFNIKHLIADKHQIAASIVLFGILILTYLVYSTGLTGTFLLDDIHILRSLNKLGGVTNTGALNHFLTDGVGTLGRPISMLAFLIDDQHFPGEPAQYRYTNLMFHLLSGVILLFFLLKLLNVASLSDRSKVIVSLSICSLWLLHPLNVSTTLYIVQRMTQLMTIFTLSGLAFYCYGRQCLSTNQKIGITWMTLSILLFGSLAVLSKENGILICAYVLVLEITILNKLYKPEWFILWYRLIIITPITVLLFYLLFKLNDFQSLYNYRDFTLAERLLTESRILVNYLFHTVIPPSSGTGLFHDDITISTSIWSPPTTFFSILLIIGLIGSALKFRHRQPVYSFAILWFFASHTLESTIIPLELYFEHRNYIAVIGPLTGVVYYCYSLSLKLKMTLFSYGVKAIPILLVTFSIVFTSQSAVVWSKPEIMYRVWYQEHPGSLRAATMHAQMFEKYGNHTRAIELLKQAYQNHPDTVALLLYITKLSCTSNVPPGFTVNDIISATKNAVYRNVLPAITKQLIQTINKNGCQYIDKDDLIKILTELENIKRLRGPAKAELILMLSDLYVQKGSLSPAIESLDRAFRANNEPSIRLRQADLLASAGLYEDALIYLEKAKLADNNKSLMQASYAQLINSMEKYIRVKMKVDKPANNN